MEERSIKELLQVMLDNQYLFEFGLCKMVRVLRESHMISYDEGCALFEYIDNNRPSKFSSVSAFMHRNKNYYWKEEKIKPRIKWLKKHIKINS